ncbi:MAG: type II toxin-antitoxin system HicA family toxin [Candidatus Omnitrophica bacterium]|nr:type II toxin-antitoxin system HicA family toxin [Candidatus Omnitrophota bacterium]
MCLRSPRDISGQKLVQLLKRYGYQVSRQTSSHIRMTYHDNHQEHHITIPDHAYIKIGTLNNILNDLAQFRGKSKEEIIQELF